MEIIEQPVVNYLMVSYKWNFFAETALRSLPGDFDVYVIHNSKTTDRIARFNQSRVRKQWCVNEERHGGVLDMVWESSQFREILECDVLIMLDHDCYFGEPFREMEKQLVDAVMSGYLIAGGAMATQYFPTFPMFAVKPIGHWPISWLPDDVRDTGQRIAKLVTESWICNFDQPKFSYHWGSMYYWYREDMIAIRDERIRHFERMICSGKWSPSEEELEEMNGYLLLKQAVSSYRDRQNAFQ